MAMDPVTLKVVASAAANALSDERFRQVAWTICLIPVIVILLVLSSPFAIFFARTEGNENGEPILNVINEMKEQFRFELNAVQADITADQVITTVMGSEDGTFIDNSVDVLIAYAVRYNVTKENARQMAVLDQGQIDALRQIFWDMNLITVTIETSMEQEEVVVTDDDGKEQTLIRDIEKKIKKIDVDCLSAEEIGESYQFDKKQMEMIRTMRSSGYGLLVAPSDVKIFLTDEEIRSIRTLVPEGTVIEGDAVAEVAKSIVRQVAYFWGGKSTAIGRDSRWGVPTEVTSPGSVTTGTIRPYGLDCSGFVTWVFINLGIPVSAIGDGTTQQWERSTSIPRQSAGPGDLAILAAPYTRKTNHIGIVVGFDEDGELLVAHCNAGADTVEITTADSAGFLYFRRPAVLMGGI